MPDFATRLRELRMGRGLRQKDLALALGLAQTTIANYEQKLRFPDEPTLVRIADYFSVTLDQLMGRANGLPGPVVPGAEEAGAGPGAGQAGATHAAAAPLAGLAAEYFRVLRQEGPGRARELLHDAMAAGRPLAEIYLQVLTPALHEVGRLWSVGELSVADEHLFSDATQQIMAGLLPRSPSRDAAAGPRCVVLPVSGESHLIGARMVADLLAIAGVDVRFLGAHLSIGHVREMLVAHPPDLLALSVTLPSNLNTAADTIRSLREKRVLSGMRILVGGQAFDAQPGLGRTIGADAVGRDAEEAVRLALKLLAEKD